MVGTPLMRASGHVSDGVRAGLAARLKGMTRIAAWIAAACALALPASAAAHQPSPGSHGGLGLDHASQDAKLRKAKARAQQRWQRMTRAERRRARRRERRRAHKRYVRASAAAGDRREIGSWSPPFTMRSNYSGSGVHSALLHTGKVLMWGDGAGGETYAWLWDPARGDGPDAVRDVTPTDASGEVIPIFCSGMSFLPDGRLLVVGGTLPKTADYTRYAGIDAAVVFDPASETWTELPRPAGSDGRWYPTQVLLADGRTLVMGGYKDDAPGGVLHPGHEIYDAETNSFTLLESDTQQKTVGLYPHLFTMPDGKVLMAGPGRGESDIFDPGALANPWTELPALARARSGGNAVLLPEGPEGSTKVVMIGGKESSVVLDSAEAIDLDDPAPAWSSFPGLASPRWSPNTVQLPDRSMVTIGGVESAQGDPTPEPERAVELYDPATGSWRTGASQAETRGYHSTAVLLPDGRVLSTGDDSTPVGSPDDTAEIYSPPYLFRGPRPVISSAADAMPWDVPFEVGVTGDVDDAVLIAPSAVTHANDMSQRVVPLAKIADHPGRVTFRSPPSPAVAPPGWYMLFVLDEGVPSVAKWVRLDATAPAPSLTPQAVDESDRETAHESEPAPGGAAIEQLTAGTRAVDATRPGLSVRLPERGSLRRLRRTGTLSARIAVDEAVTVEVRLMRRQRRVARAAIAMNAGRSTVDLHAGRRTRRWLRRAHSPRLRLTAVAVDAANNHTSWGRLLSR